MALRLGRGRFRLGCACACGLVQKQQQRFMFSLPLSTCGNVTKLTVVPPPKYQQLVLTPRRCLSAGLNTGGGNQSPSCGRRNFLQLYLCQAHKPKLPVLTPLSTAPRSNSWCSSSSPLVSPRTNLLLQNPGHCSRPFRPFRTTPRAYVHPILWLIVQPIAKITAIISGRSFRKWWKALPEHRKVYSRENLKKNWYWFAAGGATLGGLMYAYYRSHLQETPITHRVRFLPVSDKQAEKIAQEEANLILQKHAERCLPTTHPYYRLVVEITRRLVSANQDLQKIKDHTWTVTVIEDDERNAFVLPTGHIFVFTGLIQTTENMDQLAAVLGHEMAHTLLSHGAEQLSFMQLVDWMIIAVMAAIWAIMPNDGIAVVTQWFYHKVINFLLHLPYSRKLEKEADKVGLHLCAKACFDVRESSAFWMLMDCLARLEEGKVPEWLSTHPSNEKRVEHLNFIMAKAMDERKACSCPALPATDPRDRVQPKVKMTDSVVRAMQAGVNLQQVHVIQRRAPQSA